MSTTEPGPRPPSDEPLLRVDDLHVSFATEEGVVQAVDGVTFDLAPGEVLAVVGESGSGKSVSAMTLLGLTRSPNAHFEGQAHYKGTELIGASENELRKVRGAEIAMIFQDPMTSLNPVHKIGDQIIEQIREHEGVPEQQARERCIEMLEQVGIPRARERVDNYPLRVLGRDAPARDDRPGAVVQPVDSDRRRAHHRARCDDPGPDPRAHPRAARGDGRGGDPRDPRPRRGGGHRRPHRGDVLGPDRGAGDARRDLLRPPAPVHVGAAGLDHPRRPAAPRAAAGDQGPAAIAGRPARGLPLPAPLPARVRRVRQGPAARGAPARGARAPRPLLDRRGGQAHAARGEAGRDRSPTKGEEAPAA